MKQFALKALLLLSVFGLGNPAFAAGKAVSTTMEMSFVVQESCTVQTPDGSKAAPAVSCAHQAPVQVSAATADRSAALQAAPSQTLAGADGGWQIYF
jgi:hypothetical protein